MDLEMKLVKPSSNDQNQSYQNKTNSKSSNKNCGPKKIIDLYEVNIFSKAQFGFL
jgi:hypothetical protein